MRNNIYNLIRVMIIVIFYLHAGLLLSQSTKIGVQGTVRKADGNSLDDGKYAMTFRLYDALTGGTVLWSEVQPQVEIAGGIYSTQLGNVNILSLPFDADYFLSVQVDDSPEMTPRQQLTVAPYALSFKGTGNIFPSSGTIGIGTVSPTLGHNLHIKNTSGQANQLVEGSTESKVDLKKGSSTATIGLNTANFLQLNNGENTSIQFNGSDRLVVNSSGISVTGTGTFTSGVTVNSGVVSMGNFTVNGSDINNANDTDIKWGGSTKLGVRSNGTEVFGHLSVSGIKSYASTYAFYNGSNNQGCQTNASFASDYSISCESRVRAPEFNAFSDRRIKNEITTSDAPNDLKILRALQVRDYRYKDILANGTDIKKGFIAQEVRDVFSESVTKTNGFIPDIFQEAVGVKQLGNQLSISMPSKQGMKVGETVRLILDGHQMDYPVAGTMDEQTFVIADWNKPVPKHVFVYGRQVNDFLQVDYDRIHTLNVSVTQELLRKKDALERERAALRIENESLKASLENIDVRMQHIEATLPR
ncbi:MAG: tail fiber domain-containing protein [Saprospiraceae bacterium]|jgi:hypothetical protein|nr:tail fiber domain-containing protein [Saprospiraceae bacterium]